MAFTLKLVGTAEWRDRWTEENEEPEEAAVAVLSFEELSSIIAAVAATHERAELPKAA